jgi:hypothetical protein
MRTPSVFRRIIIVVGILWIINCNLAVSDAAAEKPLQVQTDFTIPDGTSKTRVTIFTVPQNKRLTIEYVSCHADIPLGQFIGVGMDTNGGGRAAFFFLATKLGTIPETPPVKDAIVISQQVRIFADPKTAVQLTVIRSASTGGVAGGCAFAGQLNEK